MGNGTCLETFSTLICQPNSHSDKSEIKNRIVYFGYVLINDCFKHYLFKYGLYLVSDLQIVTRNRLKINTILNQL